MNFQHIGTERVDPLPYSNDTYSTDISANILLIEKAHPSSLPLVYRCQHDNDLTSLERNPYLVDKEAFYLLGELVEIDKQKKNLLLKTGNTVSYKSLVTVSTPAFLAGMEQQQEFSAAIHSLINALRMQNRVQPPSLPNISSESIALMHELKQKAEASKISDSVSQAMIPSNADAPYRSHPGKCLFEFQL